MAAIDFIGIGFLTKQGALAEHAPRHDIRKN
jgi:hypothetical protein